MQPPALATVCILCRGSVADRCPIDASHRVVDVRGEAGREELAAAAWERRKANLGEGARWGGAVGAAFGTMTALAAAPTPPTLAAAFAGGAFLGALAGSFVVFVAVGRSGRRPAGGYSPGTPPAVEIHGTVVGSPGEPVAWQVEYTLHERAATTLRHGWCRAFEVALDDGRRLVVPEGLARLDAPLACWHALDSATAARWLAELVTVPEQTALEQQLLIAGHPVPYTEVHLLTLVGGARVTLAGLERDEVVEGPGGYREVQRVARFVDLPALCLEFRDGPSLQTGDANIEPEGARPIGS